MGFGQVEELLHARAQTDAEPLATTEGDQRMRELVALAEGVLPWIHETQDALATIFREGDQQDEAERCNHGQQREQPHVDATEKEDAEGDRGDDHEGAEIRLLDEQETDRQNHRGHGQKTTPEARHEWQLAHRVVGGIQRREEFHELGRLEVDDA